MGNYDRSSKWLIEHHGDSILRLVGAPEVVSWRPLQAERVQPGQLPDGLLEVQFAGREDPAHVILEIATFPEARLQRQMIRDTLLTFMARDLLPEAYALILCPKGQFRAAAGAELESTLRSTAMALRWTVVELWQLSAQDLLALEDPGLVPWVPLTRITGPVEPVLAECRRIIEERGKPEERESLLVVTQVLASLRYNDLSALSILGGRELMIESPLIKEIVEEKCAEVTADTKAAAILSVLRARLATVPSDVSEAVKGVRDCDRLDRLLDAAACCPDVDAFRAALQDP